MREERSGALLAVTGLLILAVAAPASGQETVPDPAATESLVGRWTLNRALSDDPTEELVNMGLGASRPAGPGPPPPPPPNSSAAVLRRAVEGFGIEHTDSTVAIAYPDRDLVLFTDGRKQKVRVNDDLEVEYRSWWQDGHLTVERKLESSMVLTEDYSRQAGTGRLHVLTRLSGDRLPRPISFMRVYDPAPPGEAPAGSGG